MKSLLDKILSFLVVFVLPIIVVYLTIVIGLHRDEAVEINIPLKSETTAQVDHSEFEILQQAFTDPRDVTAACLSCHNKRDDELMISSHWLWEREVDIPGRGKVMIGKKNIHNNFCTGAQGNNGSCMRCHIGYGWEDQSFDFNDPNNIDCLVCHDKTDTYFKQKGMSGWPATEETANAEFAVPDYNYISHNVGYPDRDNCGVCHFYGGGGNNVKHGDLEEALFHTTTNIDVHMGEDGPNMVCIDCHKTQNHNIRGRSYSVSAENTNRVSCVECHTEKPHNDYLLDYHNNKIACQTCHIPVYAKVNATSLYWDWSKAGRKDENGNAFKEYDADHNYSYLSIKGRFVFDNMVEPEYIWFNGTADHFFTTDSITSVPVQINKLFGEYSDPNSKIWPTKIHRGKQAYDPETGQILSVKLFAHNKGEGAFWEDLDWDAAIREGMEYNDRYWSGQYDFVETEAFWPVNHMVSKKEETLTCTACHTRNNGRLDQLTDFYLPGRDYNQLLDFSGFALIILSLIGVIVHAILRIL